MAERFFDPKVVLHGLQYRELSVDQACALFREDKEAAHYFLSDRRFGDILSDLKNDSLDSLAGRLLAVCWKLFGPSECIGLFLAHARPLVDLFFKEKLRTAHEFTDADLIRLSDAYRDKPLHPLILGAQARRLGPVANLLLSNPAEINKDLVEVKKHVSEYRFTAELNEVLDKIEADLAAGGDQFDQAALLKHLRTFFEKLHEQVAEKLRAEKPETVDGTNLQSCGQALDYLCRQGIHTEKMRDFGKALYGVLSNEGVHALKSKREYVRLCRNMVGEYALVLFFELERRLQA